MPDRLNKVATRSIQGYGIIDVIISKGRGVTKAKSKDMLKAKLLQTIPHDPMDTDVVDEKEKDDYTTDLATT
jgi:hypothetical protein